MQQSIRRPAPAGPPSRERVPRVSLIAVALTGIALASLTAGCSVQDNLCQSHEYPVAAVGVATGGACVSDGEEPPAGFVRYPEGKVPQHVDDKWDKYWLDHALDADGNVIRN